MKLTKEEFDAEGRKLLFPDQVHYHNEFLLALLNKVEGLAETSISIAQEKASSHNRNSRRHKRSSRTSEKSNFEPVDLLEYLPPNSPPGAGSDGVKYAAQVRFGSANVPIGNKDLIFISSSKKNCFYIYT